jgi:hypothetical protein
VAVAQQFERGGRTHDPGPDHDDMLRHGAML